jgi:hypothetical protein
MALTLAALAAPAAAQADVAPLEQSRLGPYEACGRDCVAGAYEDVRVPDLEGATEERGPKTPTPSDIDGDGVPNMDDVLYPFPEDFGGTEPHPNDIANYEKDHATDLDQDGIPDENDLIDPWAVDQDGDGSTEEQSHENQNQANRDRVEAQQGGSRSCTIRCLGSGITSGVVSDVVTSTANVGAIPR